MSLVLNTFNARQCPATGAVCIYTCSWEGGIVLLQILTKYPSHIIVLFISGIIGMSISSSNLEAKG